MTPPSSGPGAEPVVRRYDPERDAPALWAAKRSFELGLAAGDDGKEAAYAGKLTDYYGDRWLDWVARCVRDGPGCLLVAVPDDGSGDAPARLAGYAFLLPERLAFVWDAAVLNELWVAESSRGTGLADELFERALDHARGQTLPLDRLLLDVDTANERARAFYERHGFTDWGELVAREL
jgi:ribosomal protein S18 acetylase RimI-like enzyme